jgi:hypothetical protein
MRALVAVCSALALALGCGSKDEPEPSSREVAKQSPTQERAAPGDEDLWAPYSPAAAAPSASRRASLEPEPLPDPDAVVALHHQLCSGGATSPRCPELRGQLELVLLGDLLGLRAAGEPLEREWLRAAARAENPHLACLGLRGVIFAGGITADEDALFLAALDSPWRGPRNLVLDWSSRIPPSSASGAALLVQMLGRAGKPQPASGTDLCLQSGRDPEPNPGLAGRYPGARHRPFASDATRRWFTTPDPPEKVLAYLTKDGGQALTADGLQAAQQQKLLELTARMTQSGEPIDMKAYMRAMAEMRGTDWTAGFQNLEAAGEIRYVMVTPKQAVAVFRDDLLHATSIVAPRPNPAAPIEIPGL